MAHTTRDKKKLLDRVRRIKGQIVAIEKALEQEKDCSDILHHLAGCRGAMNGLMAEVVEGHIRSHIIAPEQPNKEEQDKVAEDLIALVKSYLR
ncbi:MAG: metal-sensing transcriptional repressor [Cryomorphaceae bacterium]|nr:metal-sensing transcriptional repressor [Cryomorphaceae bacterium]